MFRFIPIVHIVFLLLLASCASGCATTISQERKAGGQLGSASEPNHVLSAEQLERGPAEVEGALTGVLITQCNSIVAAYVTMHDGRLVRFDVRNQSQLSATALEALVYSARVSERIEFNCKGSAIEGYERHENETI